MCHPSWVIGVSVETENARETYLQATTTCIVDAASTTQVVVGLSSSLVVGTSTTQVVGLGIVIMTGGGHFNNAGGRVIVLEIVIVSSVLTGWYVSTYLGFVMAEYAGLREYLKHCDYKKSLSLIVLHHHP